MRLPKEIKERYERDSEFFNAYRQGLGVLILLILITLFAGLLFRSELSVYVCVFLFIVFFVELATQQVAGRLFHVKGIQNLRTCTEAFSLFDAFKEERAKDVQVNAVLSVANYVEGLIKDDVRDKKLLRWAEPYLSLTAKVRLLRDGVAYSLMKEDVTPRAGSEDIAHVFEALRNNDMGAFSKLDFGKLRPSDGWYEKYRTKERLRNKIPATIGSVVSFLSNNKLLQMALAFVIVASIVDLCFLIFAKPAVSWNETGVLAASITSGVVAAGAVYTR